ncbi:hypothetical protein [Flavobacterium cupreum]|nr:hypothetical protein [Flavobacterium cupreum]
MNKFIEQPVSLNSGLANVSIPIYTIGLDGLQLPLNLDYFTGGVRVNEIASEVGLGWTLNLGGSISRAVRSNPDDLDGGYMNTIYTVAQARAGVENVEFNNDLQYLDQRDYEPDVFTFNCSSFSGKFYFDKEQNEFIQVPKTDAKIRYSRNSAGQIISWILTDDKGNQYFFGQTEDLSRTQIERSSSTISRSYTDTGIVGGASNIADHIITWYLMEVKTVASNKVSFFYTESAEYSDVIKTEQSFLYKGILVNNDQGQELSSGFLQRIIKNTSVSRIETKNEQILIAQSSQSRLDATNAKSLEYVTVLNNKGSQIKKFKFNYGYFSSLENTNETRISNPEQYKYRLKLLSLNELNTENTAVKTTSFTYENSFLPNRNSNAQDAWGFYNGKSNVTLIPDLAQITKINRSFLANRNIDEDLSKAFILKSMKLPTGGTVEYEYESNRVGLIENKSYPENFDQKESKALYFTPLVPDPGPEGNGNLNFDNYYRQNFTIQNVTGPVAITVNIEGCSNTPVPSLDCHFFLKIKGITNPGYTQNIYSGQFTLNLPDGEYYVEATKNGSPVSNYAFTSSLFWNEKMLSPEGGERVGGLRIAKVTLKEANQPDIVKQFKYINPALGVTSGRMYQYPVFFEANYKGNEDVGSFKATSSSIVQTSLTANTPVSYQYAAVLMPSSKDSKLNGKIEYEYATNFSSLENTGVYRTISLDKTEKNIGWLEGKLLHEKTFAYDNDNKTYNLIEETINNYEILDPKSIPNFGVLFEHRGVYQALAGGPAEVNFYRFAFYPLFTGRHKMTWSLNKKYLTNGPVEQLTNYQYKTETDLLKSQKEKTSLANEETETKYYYAPDAEMSTEPFINELKTANIVSTPLVVQTFKAGVKLSEQKTVYDKSAATSGLLLPKTVYANKGLAAINVNLDKKITFNQYDTNGNILQYTLESGVPVSIIWGYTKTQPIAKIENATIPQITTALGVSDLSALNETNLTAINNLRNNSTFVNAMITTYTFIPGVGISTRTDPKGDTTTFTYDTFGRLEFVKDKNGNILSENQYNYKP